MLSFTFPAGEELFLNYRGYDSDIQSYELQWLLLDGSGDPIANYPGYIVPLQVHYHNRVLSRGMAALMCIMYCCRQRHKTVSGKSFFSDTVTDFIDQYSAVAWSLMIRSIEAPKDARAYASKVYSLVAWSEEQTKPYRPWYGSMPTLSRIEQEQYNGAMPHVPQYNGRSNRF